MLNLVHLKVFRSVLHQAIDVKGLLKLVVCLLIALVETAGKYVRGCTLLALNHECRILRHPLHQSFLLSFLLPCCLFQAHQLDFLARAFFDEFGLVRGQNTIQLIECADDGLGLLAGILLVWALGKCLTLS